MSSFDLKPLSATTIDEMKIRADQLWEIKIDENIYGPFETLQLRHFAEENREALTRALVSPLSVDSWRPFSEVREFIHESHYSGPYWLLLQGQKSSPLSVAEISKRIELGTVGRNDEISENDGRHWVRIAAHPEFESHFTTGNSLPELPLEVTFQKSKLEVLEGLETRANIPNDKDNVATLTHISFALKEKTRAVNLQDVKLPRPEQDYPDSWWGHVKTPALVALPVLVIGFFVFRTSGTPAPETTGREVASETFPQEKSRKALRVKKDSWTRTPSTTTSVSEYERSPITQSQNYDYAPTVIETHQEPDQNYPDPRAEADQVAEIQDQENRPEEHSLLDPQPNRDPAQEGESLDANMNPDGQLIPDPAVDAPVVEEVSDF